MRSAILIWFLLFASPVFALQVKTVDIRATSYGAEVTVTLDRPASHQAFVLQNPARLVVDLPIFDWQARVNGRFKERDRLVNKVRYSRFDQNTSRIVLDLAAEVEAISIAQKNSTRNVKIFKLVRAQAGEGSLSVATLPFTRPNAATSPRKPEKIALPTSRKPEASKTEMPLIVIDAGHGGQDPGAIGVGKTQEKKVTLSYALALRDALRKTGKFRAEVTRATDTFILLRERFRVARRMKADLFLSLHADASPNRKAKGLSVYTLSEEASDAEAAQLAQKENKADLLAGVDLSHEDKEVAGILLDLARRETKNKSIILAEKLIISLNSKIQLLTNPHRFAGFAVLKAPDIPSALIEIGFLSNAKEEKRLKSSAHKRKVVRGIVEGVGNYFADEVKPR